MVLTPSLKRQNSEQAGSEAAAGHDRPDESTQAKRRRTGGTHNPQVFGISQRQWRQKPYRDLCGIILRWMRSKDRNQFFYYPVDVNEVPTYRDIIKNPMSFDLMEARASKRAYKTVDDIRKDFNLICTNAMTFNPEGSPWHKAAEKLQADGEKQFDLAQLHGLRLPDDSIESSTVNSRAGSRRSYTRRDHHGTATQVNRNSVEAVDKLPGSLRNALHAIEYTGTPSNMTKDVIEAYATVVEENRFSNRGAPNMLVRVGSSADFIDHTSPGKATVMGSSSSSVLPGELEPKSAEKSLRKFLEGIDGLPEGIVDRHLRRRLGGCPSTVAPLNDCRVFGLDTDDFVAFNGTLRVEREFTGYILGVGYENAMQAAGLSDAGVDTEPLKEMAQRHRASREKQIQNVRGNATAGTAAAVGSTQQGAAAGARVAGATSSRPGSYLTPATTTWSTRYNMAGRQQQQQSGTPAATAAAGGTPYNQAAQWAALNQANRTAHLRAQQQASVRTRPAMGQNAYQYRPGMQQLFHTAPSSNPIIAPPPAGSALAEFQQRLASASPEQRQVLLRSLGEAAQRQQQQAAAAAAAASSAGGTGKASGR